MDDKPTSSEVVTDSHKLNQFTNLMLYSNQNRTLNLGEAKRGGNVFLSDAAKQ